MANEVTALVHLKTGEIFETRVKKELLPELLEGVANGMWFPSHEKIIYVFMDNISYIEELKNDN